MSGIRLSLACLKIVLERFEKEILHPQIAFLRGQKNSDLVMHSFMHEFGQLAATESDPLSPSFDELDEDTKLFVFANHHVSKRERADKDSHTAASSWFEIIETLRTAYIYKAIMDKPSARQYISPAKQKQYLDNEEYYTILAGQYMFLHFIYETSLSTAANNNTPTGSSKK